MIAAIYVATGLLFAIYFATAGITKLDPVAKGSSVVFRILTVPGAVALWPLLLVKRLSLKGGAV